MLLRYSFECCQSLSCQAPKWRKIPFISHSFIQVHGGFLFESDGTGRDMSDYATRHIALKLMYLGSRYTIYFSQKLQPLQAAWIGWITTVICRFHHQFITSLCTHCRVKTWTFNVFNWILWYLGTMDLHHRLGHKELLRFVHKLGLKSSNMITYTH
jgi:hypothetical protein